MTKRKPTAIRMRSGEPAAAAGVSPDTLRPMRIHDRVPPGVPVMKAEKKAIADTDAETTPGAEIVISTENPEALDAIHDFLRVPIGDHRTGDSAEIAGLPKTGSR